MHYSKRADRIKISDIRYRFLFPNSNHSPATRHTLSDIARFSESLGFRMVQFKRAYLMGIFPLLWREIGGLPKMINAFKNGKILLIPYPALFNPTYPSMVLTWNDLKLLEKILPKKKYILFVFDMPVEQTKSREREKYLYSYQLEEILFRNADVILTFNRNMDRVLIERYGLEDTPFVHFEILEYYTEFVPPLGKKVSFPRRVALASNLSEEYLGMDTVRYFKSFNRGDVTFSLFGQWVEWVKNLPNSVNYRGFVGDWMKLHKELSEHDFGLISYSEGIIRYLKFGTPSKFSAYITSGIPVLVPKGAGYLSEIVKRYKVGLVYADDPAEVASRVSPNRYERLRENVLNLATKIRSGYFFKRALMRALNIIAY